MRGGQVTLFVAIGLVLLLTVGLFYVIITLNQQDIPDEAVQSSANIGVLANYLQSCIDTIIYDELETLGRQGGVLTFDQWPYGRVSENNVLYGITRNIQDTGLLPRQYDPPQYPDFGIAIGQETSSLDSWQDGYFGDVWLPPPCSKKSTNRPGSTFTCAYYPDNPPGVKGPSMQERLEEQVRQRIKGCADLRAFEQATGQDVEKVGEPMVNITLTHDNMIVMLRYPLQLEGSTTTRFEEFTQRYRIRLLPIMQFALDLAKEETRNVTFNITGDYQDIPSWRSGISVLRKQDIALTEKTSIVESPHADLITIVDSRSLIEGQSFTFSFLVEDRVPMLDHITDAEWSQIESAGFAQAIGWDPDDGPLHGNLDYDAASPPSLVRVSITDSHSNTDYQER